MLAPLFPYSNDPWTWSSTYLAAVAFYPLDLVQQYAITASWKPHYVDLVQRIELDQVQLPARPRPIILWTWSKHSVAH